MNSYLLGQPVKLSLTLMVDGVLTDPTDLTLRIQPLPGGTVVTVAMGSLTHPSVGQFSYAYKAPAVGNYGVSWDADGVGDGYIESFYRVTAHQVGT